MHCFIAVYCVTVFPRSTKKCKIFFSIFAQIFHKCKTAFNSSVFHFQQCKRRLIPIFFFGDAMIGVTQFFCVCSANLRKYWVCCMMTFFFFFFEITFQIAESVRSVPWWPLFSLRSQKVAICCTMAFFLAISVL